MVIETNSFPVIVVAYDEVFYTREGTPLREGQRNKQKNAMKRLFLDIKAF